MNSSPFPVEKRPKEGRRIIRPKKQLHPVLPSGRIILLKRISLLLMVACSLFLFFNAEEIRDKFFSFEQNNNTKGTALDSSSNNPPTESELIIRREFLKNANLPTKWWSPSAEMELLFLGPGEVRMGSSSKDPHLSLDEQPLTRVHLSTGFWIGRHEVTQGSFEKVMKYNPSSAPSGNPFIPVNRVDWSEAMKFCETLNQMEKESGFIPADLEYRLPSEAEWEYACRAGSITPYSVIWEQDSNPSPPFWSFEVFLADSSLKGPFEIYSSQPNKWGLYEMHGNVAEWTLDVYQPYSGSQQWDRVIFTGEELGFRVVRGGDYRSLAKEARSANRQRESRAAKKDTIGFRIVLGYKLEKLDWQAAKENFDE